MNLSIDLNFDDLLKSLPLVGLYAETHFKFWIPFSRYFRREPELIFDAPWRLQPGQTPTLFLVIKDAHVYPVQLNAVEISVSQNGQSIGHQSWQLDRYIVKQQTELEFELTDFDTPAGEIEVMPVLHYTIDGKKRKLKVDNYLQIKKPPLRITLAEDRLPEITGWLNGDTHLHTSLTTDQIEFGASLEMTRKGAELFGMDFISATDHSYDLDDLPDNYLRNDPELRKWRASRQSIQTLNDSHVVPIIPGEEISVANHLGATVHFLHFNDATYFPGNGDSGDNWPKVSSELSIDDVLAQRSDDTVSIGAHTAYQFPWLPRILLNRGTWESEDHNNSELDGVQILCGTPASSSFQKSRQLWIDALLKGHRLGAYGGSDGHGNFNRNWHINLPTWSLGIHEDQIFGQSRTLLRTQSARIDSLIEAMKLRRSAVTTGPMGDLTVQDGDSTYGIGDSLVSARDEQLSIELTGISTREFGSEMDITLYWGDLQKGAESIIHHEVDLVESFTIELPFSPDSNGYLRIEITSEGSRWPGLYLSSPIWIELKHPV